MGLFDWLSGKEDTPKDSDHLNKYFNELDQELGVEPEKQEFWYVEWYRRFDHYSYCIEKCSEAFYTKDQADKFASQLRLAYKLIRHTSGNSVEVVKR